MRKAVTILFAAFTLSNLWAWFIAGDEVDCDYLEDFEHEHE